MKRLLFVCSLSFLIALAKAQDSQYMQFDQIGLNGPDAKGITTDDIANYINKYCKSDEQKVRAAYVWVISHISYSTDSAQYIVTDEDHQRLITVGMRRRKGLCENFAAIFNDICKKVGLQSFAIEGYTHQNGGAKNTSHAWDAVQIVGEWYLFDPTWDAVQAWLSAPVRTSYFMIRPVEFIQSHMPFDPMLQFLEHPVTFKEFNNGISESKNNSFFNYKDSINEYEKEDSYQRYMNAYMRIQKNGTPNEMVKIKLTQLRSELEIIYQDKDSVLYNTAVADYNKATKLFNDYISFRNNQFKPAKTNTEVFASFDEMKKYLSNALSLLEKVNASSANLILNTGDIEYAINKLSTHVAEQQEFYKNYTFPQAEK